MVGTWTAPSHSLNQCWDIVNWTHGNKHQWNSNQNSYILIQEKAFENVVWKIAAILSWLQCVNITNTWQSMNQCIFLNCISLSLVALLMVVNFNNLLINIRTGQGLNSVSWWYGSMQQNAVIFKKSLSFVILFIITMIFFFYQTHPIQWI